MKTKKLKIGTAVKPMLVSESGTSDKKYADVIKKYADVIKNHSGKSLVEVKSDGYRLQVHKYKNYKHKKIDLYTRNLNSVSPYIFPELREILDELPDGIFDGEIVGIKDGINGFNAIKKRMRKDLDADLVEQYPLQIKFFDVLNLENKTLIELPLVERRKILENYVENVSEQEEILNALDLKQRLEDVINNRGLEGLVCKNPDSQYLIDKRTKDWIKLKKFLTLDLVVLGLYKGKGRAAELPFAALLLGTKNNGKYETITKVGLLNKDKVNSIYESIKNNCTDVIPRNVIISDVINKKTYEKKAPFCYVKPGKSVVLEIEALDITKSKNWHSCGFDVNEKRAYSLRIPIVREIRNDKEPKDATTSRQIAGLYKE